MAHGTVTMTKEGSSPLLLTGAPKDRSRKPLNPTFPLNPQTEKGSGVFCTMGSAPGTSVMSEASVPELCIGSWGPVCWCREDSIQPQLQCKALLCCLSHPTLNFSPGPSPPNLRNSSLPSRTDIPYRMTMQRLQE